MEHEIVRITFHGDWLHVVYRCVAMLCRPLCVRHGLPGPKQVLEVWLLIFKTEICPLFELRIWERSFYPGLFFAFCTKTKTLKLKSQGHWSLVIEKTISSKFTDFTLPSGGVPLLAAICSWSLLFLPMCCLESRLMLFPSTQAGNFSWWSNWKFSSSSSPLVTGYISVWGMQQPTRP